MYIIPNTLTHMIASIPFFTAETICEIISRAKSAVGRVLQTAQRPRTVAYGRDAQ